MKRLGVYSLLPVLWLISGLRITMAAPNSSLRSMSCTGIVVEDLSNDGHKLGLDEERLKERLLVLVKSKLPRLTMETDCESWLYLNITTIETFNRAGKPTGYAASVNL